MPKRLKSELNWTAYLRRGITCARLWPKLRNASSVSLIASLFESRPLASFVVRTSTVPAIFYYRCTRAHSETESINVEFSSAALELFTRVDKSVPTDPGRDDGAAGAGCSRRGFSFGQNGGVKHFVGNAGGPRESVIAVFEIGLRRRPSTYILGADFAALPPDHLVSASLAGPSPERSSTNSSGTLSPLR
jgi:hypothetical protein